LGWSRCSCCLLVEVNGTTRWLWDRSCRSTRGRPRDEGDEEGADKFNGTSCYQQSGFRRECRSTRPGSRGAIGSRFSSSHGAEACNVAGRYPPASLYLSSKFHDRRRDAKHCHGGRHPQESSRPVGVVHDEKLLAIRPAASDCVIPRDAGKLARQRLTSDDLAGTAWHPGRRPRGVGVTPVPYLRASRRKRSVRVSSSRPSPALASWPRSLPAGTLRSGSSAIPSRRRPSWPSWSLALGPSAHFNPAELKGVFGPLFRGSHGRRRYAGQPHLCDVVGNGEEPSMTAVVGVWPFTGQSKSLRHSRRHLVA
jgi:hypothetical protein